jgi:6-phosphogluconate dehydrogenase
MGDADIALIGMAVMGQNLALNIADHGFKIAVFNRTVAKVDAFIAGPAQGKSVVGTHSLEELCRSLKRPRRIILMVKAGQPVDELIDECLPYLEPGDILIDGGNSLFTDTERRCRDLAARGILFVGAGISGGEEGARHGPSIMPGGSAEAWPHIQPIFQAIAARAIDGEPCCTWIGEGGAGHYVKMVHNGIEYGDMQIICEAYDLLKGTLKTTPQQLSGIFAEWNKGPLDSYLIEIASHVFAYLDTDGLPLIDKILDVAGQKGTGKWTTSSALDLGLPLTLIAEAVFARNLSALKGERIKASEYLKAPQFTFEGDHAAFVDNVQQALYASKIISYAQGFMLLRQAANTYGWHLDYGAIAAIWRGGCIIRSRFLNAITDAFRRNPQLENLLFDVFFSSAIEQCQQGWRSTLTLAIQQGIPTPCFSSALAFYDGLRSSRLPANLLQGLRDYFGAHTYERIDQPRGTFCHTDWIGSGGQVSSGSYNA